MHVELTLQLWTGEDSGRFNAGRPRDTKDHRSKVLISTVEARLETTKEAEARGGEVTLVDQHDTTTKARRCFWQEGW